MKFIQQNPTIKISALFLVTVACCFIGLTACTEIGGTIGGKSLKNAPKVDGKLKMLRSIAEIGRKLNTPENGYAAQAKIAYFDSILNVTKDPNERIQTQMKKSMVLLEYGDEAASVAQFENLLQIVGKNQKARTPALYWLGTAYLRLAERSNCVAGHTADACIMPLQAGGLHHDKTGSRDNDGDQDIHVEMGGAYRGDGYPSSLYMNPGQNNNHWIYLQLEGTKSNRAAIGAKITVKFHENGKERMVYRELNSGGSFGSSPLRREIGIGQATVIDEITINWPASGITQVLKNVQPNQLIKIKEGQEGFTPVPLNKMTFKKADGTIPVRTCQVRRQKQAERWSRQTLKF